MATVQNMDVVLRGKTGDLDKKLKESEGKIAQFSGKIGGLLSGKAVAGWTALAGFGGAALTAAASVHAVTEQIEQVSQVVDASNRIGIGTEALMGFQYAAQMSGMEAGEMSAALQKMGVNVSKAAMGTGKAKKSLKELGIDAKAFNELSPEEQFKQLADSLEKVENPADRARHAIAIFGNAKILNAIEGGSAALDEFREKADRLGLTLDDKTAAAVESAGDAIDTAGLSFTGIARTITGSLAPAIESAANMITSVVESVTGWIRENKDEIDTFVAFVAACLENSGVVWEIWKDTVALQLVGFCEDVAHAFTEVLPELFDVEIEFLKDFFEKMAKNAALGAAAVAVAIATGSTDAFNNVKWEGLTDSFNDAWFRIQEALPRKVSDTEKILQEDLAKQFGILFDATERIKKRDLSKPKEKPKGEPDDTEKDKKVKGTAQLGLAERGSKEAYEAIAKITNKELEIEQDIADNTKDTNVKLDKILDRLDDIEQETE
ncbi:MAG: phage tail tape measure protein [Burkholderiales bacterium]|nr:phage tail tape measure protein [Burkholderiales bacterium]